MSSREDVVIRVRSLGKAYQLYSNERNWLKQVLFGSFKTYYRSFWALRDVSFDVRRGDSIAIVGRNGCGKSTLLQMICGMTRPTKGELWVRGRVAPILGLGATFDLESTGRANIFIGGAVLGLKRHQVLQRLHSIAEFAGIGEFLDQPMKFYSSGMRTRLAFAICAHIDAEILIIDEALAVGDAAFQRKCLDWIDGFRKTGTLLFVSHSEPQVTRLCRHAIWIDKGRIRLEGPPREVIRSYGKAMQNEPDNMDRFSAT
jgi:lipopolysaccharide transport system ATP-binding protein